MNVVARTVFIASALSCRERLIRRRALKLILRNVEESQSAMVEPSFPEAMNGNLIDGRAIAARVRQRVAREVQLMADRGETLVLVVVRVGDDPASAVYVKHKVRACAEVGIESRHVHLPASVSEDDLLLKIEELNEDDSVDGILVQLPVPDHIAAARVTAAVSPLKDADGFHPDNLGRLFSRFALLEPCTPIGIMAMLRAIGVDLTGKNAVVVGRSVIVGRPLSDLLLRSNATLTTCHRHTQNLRDFVERADILVSAAGVRGLIPGAWVKPGAVVIDVGMNRTDDGKLCGDVEFDAAATRAAAITPVPGGVGPMTVAMLLWNTLLAATQRRLGYDAALELRRSLFDDDLS